MFRERIPLTGLTFPELTELLESESRAKAVLRWMYRTGLPASLPDSVPGVARTAWERARQSCRLPKWSLLAERRAQDGTVKLGVDFAGRTVETVLIPGPQRSTVCLSSQSGCTRRCAFCATARQGFRGNLTAAEIVAQYLLAQKLAPRGLPARNVVLMGMGEPMDNLDSVLQAILILTRSPYPALSPAHVTVSTSGVVPGIERFLRESDAHLALSLNSTTDQLRRRLMPHARAWPLANVLDTIRRCISQRGVFVEYLLIAGVNDTHEDAQRLPRLLDGLNVRINLIPFNRFPGSDLQPPGEDSLLRFQKSLSGAGFRCIIRQPRGADISAACGQLAMTERTKALVMDKPEPNV